SALPSHGRGHRFDSYITHRYHSSVLPGFLFPFLFTLLRQIRMQASTRRQKQRSTKNDSPHYTRIADENTKNQTREA
ncbi:hypothetical protein, partial [Bifidobacterium adolescentis]|uniref:hypothetical protein n=1 Tax=Bifidobacterium adolescentis TaxID=1680 RepID=UPI001E524C71